MINLWILRRLLGALVAAVSSSGQVATSRNLVGLGMLLALKLVGVSVGFFLLGYGLKLSAEGLGLGICIVVFALMLEALFSLRPKPISGQRC